ncbi:S8 family serine peptidase (plasmid) [Verrucomicrobiaceae bacterium 227]
MKIRKSDGSVLCLEPAEVGLPECDQTRKPGEITAGTERLLARSSLDVSGPSHQEQDSEPLPLVSGDDPEICIAETNRYPWSLIVSLKITGQNGGQWHGTGWLSGPETIITAGHNVFHRDNLGGWATEIEVSVRVGKSKKRAVSCSFSTLDEWFIASEDSYNLGAIHLKKPLLTNGLFFEYQSMLDEEAAPGVLNVSGYSPAEGRSLLKHTHVRPKTTDLSGEHLWRDLEEALPRGLAGAPVFVVRKIMAKGKGGNVARVLGVHVRDWTGDSDQTPQMRILDADLVGVIRYWSGAEAVKPKQFFPSRQTGSVELPYPGRLGGTGKTPLIVYITGDIPSGSPVEIKRSWDQELFDNPMGCDTMLLAYNDLLPGTDIPLVPTGGFIEGIRRAAMDRYGPHAADFYDELIANIAETEDNPLLFGAANALAWLNVALTYFFSSREETDDGPKAKRVSKNKVPRSPKWRNNIRSLVLDELSDANKDGRDVVVVTHGFGSVILYDALCYAREIGAGEEVGDIEQVIALANPLGYAALRNKFTKEQEVPPSDFLPWPTLVKHWLDLSLRTDPIAADNPTFEPSENSSGHAPYYFVESSAITTEELQVEGARTYLKLPLLRSFLSILLPKGFGSPVADFVFARNVADQLSLRGVRLPVLFELNREEETGDSLEKRADSLITNIVKVVEDFNLKRNLPFDFDALNLVRMKRYIAADLFPRELRLLKRKLAPTGRRDDQSAAAFRHVWQNTSVRSLLDKSGKAVHAEAARRTDDADGAGITWAVLDTGVDATHEHFTEHLNLRERFDATLQNVTRGGDPVKISWEDDLKPDRSRDRSGHGTHVCGIIAGQGTWEGQSYFGIAPKTQIYSYRVLDETGQGRESAVIRALEHIYETNSRSQKLVIHGVNLSLGCIADPAVYGCGHSAICRELRRLWFQGVVVCVAAGNAGMLSLQPNGSSSYRNVNLDISIGDPANLQECIAVGSVHKLAPHNYGVSYFSSRGPTADGRMKPDCVAPGERIMSANSGSITGYRSDSGTSMACPHVSGVVAAFLSRKREFIGQPERVKQILKECCIDINRDRYHQGAGIPNLMEMLARY